MHSLSNKEVVPVKQIEKTGGLSKEIRLVNPQKQALVDLENN
ncbi:1440_t:CDS:1, partial [Racocetra fulgida]